MNLSMALANHSHDTLSFAQPSPLCQSFCWSLESIPCVRRGHWIGIPLARLRTRLQLSEKSERAVLVRLTPGPLRHGATGHQDTCFQTDAAIRSIHKTSFFL